MIFLWSGTLCKIEEKIREYVKSLENFRVYMYSLTKFQGLREISGYTQSL